MSQRAKNGLLDKARTLYARFSVYVYEYTSRSMVLFKLISYTCLQKSVLDG